MQQLRAIRLVECLGPAVTSLDRLSGLSRLTSLYVSHAPGLGGLWGVETLVQLRQLKVKACNVSSLQPLAGLSTLKWLDVDEWPEDTIEDEWLDEVDVEPWEVWEDSCDTVSGLSNLEGLEELSGCLERLRLSHCSSLRSLAGVECETVNVEGSYSDLLPW